MLFPAPNLALGVATAHRVMKPLWHPSHWLPLFEPLAWVIPFFGIGQRHRLCGRRFANSRQVELSGRTKRTGSSDEAIEAQIAAGRC